MKTQIREMAAKLTGQILGPGPLGAPKGHHDVADILEIALNSVFKAGLDRGRQQAKHGIGVDKPQDFYTQGEVDTLVDKAQGDVRAELWRQFLEDCYTKAQVDTMFEEIDNKIMKIQQDMRV